MPGAQDTEAIAKVLDVGLLRLVYKHVAWVGLCGVTGRLRNKAGLRHIEVAAALVHFLACFVGSQRRPLGYDVEVRGDLQQLIQNKGPGLGDSLLHRQYADKVIAHAEMIALGLNVGIDNLIVKKLR